MSSERTFSWGEGTSLQTCVQRKGFSEGLAPVACTCQSSTTLTAGKEGFIPKQCPKLSSTRCLHGAGKEGGAGQSMCWQSPSLVHRVLLPLWERRDPTWSRSYSKANHCDLPTKPYLGGCSLQAGPWVYIYGILRHHEALIISGQMLHPELWREPMPLSYFKSSLSQSIQAPATFKSSLLAGTAAGWRPWRRLHGSTLL